MKTTLSLLSALLLTASAVSAAGLTVTHLANTPSSIVLSKAPNCVLLPIQHNAPMAQLEILDAKNGLIGKHIDIPLAIDKIDCFIPLQLKDLGLAEQKLTLKIHGRAADAACWGKIKAEESFTQDLEEPYRPLYHHTPPYGWANDPNGMFYKDGVYHFYYQFNPYATTWGNMHWAHTTSTDLINWKDEGIVLTPDNLGYIFSGSGVVDTQNVSGFGKGAVLAFYTSAGGRQIQSMAYSTDNGYSFTKYGKNPVVASTVDTDFRDPKVIYHKASGKYIMIIAAGPNAAFYSSTNLKDWKFESKFGEGYGAHGAAWECTDLFPLRTPDGKEHWVLLVNMGASLPVLNSGTQYFIGQFDGSKFTSEQDPKLIKLQDYGMDHYATVTWNNAPDERVIATAWVSNFRYFKTIPTQNFRGMHSIPRDLFLFEEDGDIILGSRPSPEMAAARKPSKALSRACELCFSLAPKAGSESTSFSLENDKGEHYTFTLNFAKNKLSVDRSQSGIVNFSPYFIEPIHMPLHGSKGAKASYDFRLFIDSSSIECFVNDGRSVMTNLVFPTAPYSRIKFDEQSTELMDYKVYQLK